MSGSVILVAKNYVANVCSRSFSSAPIGYRIAKCKNVQAFSDKLYFFHSTRNVNYIYNVEIKFMIAERAFKSVIND